MQSVLILGAGLVAGPIIHHLLNQGYIVSVASNTPERAEELTQHHPNARVVDWSVEDDDGLRQLIDNHHLVVSLLPYVFHIKVAEQCIAAGKNMVTTSYVKPEMQALDEAARKAGIIILNEIGLDPGIDHMSAMRVIDHIHNKGGKVDEFYSICGALPSPDSADNPFQYKFSWSPRGVLLAGNNDGRYLKKGKIVEVPTEELFSHIFELNFKGVGVLEVYPNRNSTDYIEIYRIPEVQTIFRGTFRLKGWCESLDAMKKLHLLTAEHYGVHEMSYAEFIMNLNQLQGNDPGKAIAGKLGIPVDSTPIKALQWLGWFSEEKIQKEESSAFDITADLMLSKMNLENDDKDMVVLQHIFTGVYPDGSSEIIKSSMLDYGSPATDTAIARTVTLPAAIAVEMILQGQIPVKGVHRPVIPEIYNPVLNALEKLGIRMIEEYGLPLSEGIA
ncbi:MAG: saccharopine dehydrogenase C-terminal domain-containing protein [Bacteroidales bacterium]